MVAVKARASVNTRLKNILLRLCRNIVRGSAHSLSVLLRWGLGLVKGKERRDSGERSLPNVEEFRERKLEFIFIAECEEKNGLDEGFESFSGRYVG